MKEFTLYISKFFFGDASFLQFQFPWILLFGLSVLLLYLIIFWGLFILRRRNLKRFADSGFVKMLVPKRSVERPIFKWALASTAIAFLTIAAANPRIGTKKQEVERAGIDLMICIDVSKSMWAEDIKPNRIQRAKFAIANIINQLGSDRIGLVVFAGDAFLQLPLTTDHAAAKMFLEGVHVDMVPTRGTSIGSAIRIAQKGFGKNTATSKAIIIITDGENHDQDAIDKARKAKEKGIQVFTLGMGSTKGATIPIRNGDKLIGMKKDRSGSTVVTRLNEQALIDIAEAGGGEYYLATNQNIGLDYLFNEINKLEKTKYETKEFTNHESKFQIFLVTGLIFLAFDQLIFNRKGKWI